MPLDPLGPLTQYREQIDKNEADILSLQITTKEIMRAVSDQTQQPVTTDTPLQLNFGPAQSNSAVTLDTAGTFTFTEAANYSLRLRLVFGRTGGAGISLVFARALLNGVQIGESVAAELDDGDFSVPTTFEGIIDFRVGDTLSVEVLRSSDGNDSGGVFAFPSPLVGWNASPSCQILLSAPNIISTAGG